MGGQGAGADTDSPATSTSSAGSAGSARLSGGRRWAVFAAYLLAAAILFTVYLQLSRTAQLNSDSANILLMGSDLLHGNLLLHGLSRSDTSFCTTQLPLHMLLELAGGTAARASWRNSPVIRVPELDIRARPLAS